MPFSQSHSFDAQSLNRCRSSIPARRTRPPGPGPGDSRAVRVLIAPLGGIFWALAASEATGWLAGWVGLIVLTLGLGVALHFLVARLSVGPRGEEVGPAVRSLLGLAMVPFAVWLGRSLGLGSWTDGLDWGALPSIGVAGLLAGFLPFRRSLKGPWLLDLIAAAGLAIVATALLVRVAAGWRAELSPRAWELGLAAGLLAFLACLISQATARDLIDVRLRWQRFAYLAQWPLPLLFLDWGRGIGLALGLLAWWDLNRIGRKTAGGRVVFEGTADLLSIPALATLLTLAPEGRALALPTLALAGRFVVGWLSAGPCVALLMAWLPVPRTGSPALEFVVPALLTVGLRPLLIRPIGWLWAWGGWTAWLIVMDPPIGLAFAVGTLPALAGVVRLSYRYEPRPLAIALVTASAAAAVLGFGQGPIAALRAVLIDWGGALRAGAHPVPIVLDDASLGPTLLAIAGLTLLGWLAFREWRSESPERVTPALVLELSSLGVLIALLPWIPLAWLAPWIVAGLLPVVLLADRPATRTVSIAWGLAALAGLLAAGSVPIAP